MNAQKFPRMIKIGQNFGPHTSIGNVYTAVRGEIEGILPSTRMKPGDSVAITVGSRGIANLAEIVRAIVDELKSWKCKPFLVPAMGSHGGATAKGQVEVLAHYGITEDGLAVPIKSSMDVEEVGRTEDGLSVFVDKNALSADHIVVFNRVKPHTDFRGDVESGLLKMMTIGLGKHKGAMYYHQAAVKLSGPRVIRTVGRTVIHNCPVAFGLAVVENAYDETAIVSALLPQDIETGEGKLLTKAREIMAKLPFQEMDLLIVDRMGKNISGTGMDTNVVGRVMNIYTPEPEWPKITRIFVRDLTEETGGNAIGLGMADFTTEKLAGKINWDATYTNAITGLVVEKARLPVVCKNDKEALETALKTIGLVSPDEAKVVWIRDTLSLEEVMVSEAFLPFVREMSNLEVRGEPKEFSFYENGDLVDDL